MFNGQMSRRGFVGCAVAGLAVPGGAVAAGEWMDLFDGKTLNGWRPSEHKASWQVVDGMLAANGPRSHLFYTGPVRAADFKNFELEVEVVTEAECNSGVYFHTAYQESGFPEKGFEIQVNNTAKGDGGYRERKKTGSLYGLRNMYKQLAQDGQPFQLRVAVRGKNVQIHLNQELLVDYVEPTPPVIPEGGEHGRFLDRGTFALQCHNDGSHARYRRVRVRVLPDDLPAYTGPVPVVDATYRAIINSGRHNIPMVDSHAFLGSGLTLERLLKKSRRDGITYGVVASQAALRDDAAAQRWLRPFAGHPVFCALYADQHGRHALSRDTVRTFDFVLADSRTWMDAHGRPVRLFQEEESKRIPAPEAFLDSLLAQTVERLHTEPIDIYTYPTYLPSHLRANADTLWTEGRIDQLIAALRKNEVAIELSTIEQLPSRRFVQRAKEAGCQFVFGSGGNSEASLGRCEYGLALVKECGLDWPNFYAPGAWQSKAVDRKWVAS